ncbi:uncharacterized protein LOC104886319 [Beta vulgaris subsp. vulgaris]|uniref:uncharacterized protein LOC104886319 n=1 Tax=Beta vulgaris subsp. vulgaris TaxID=3555 RepID=UPI0020372557|nr:uncharacterized protein LOC104886319 [Beta vulgaris subsp. vulgaris]
MTDHYRKVMPYLEALKTSSPGTSVELVTTVGKGGAPVFQRFFTCFEGLQKGFMEGCRKVICVDACFLKTFLGGQLLSAVGRDGNEQMYPIAWAVVESENNESWQWFFDHIQACLQLGDGEGVAIISDEHQAIVNAVATVLPKAEHRHSYNQADYNEALEELGVISEDVANAFKAYNPQLFCRAFLDCSMRTNAITNNMAETFNAYIINARTKHLLYMMEDIRAALMQRLVLKRQEMEKVTSALCPRIQAMLEKEKENAAKYDVLPSTDNLFNVNYYLDQLVVDLNARTCTCRKWEMKGVPCCHAITFIYFQNKEAEDFVDHVYRKDVYLAAYAGSIPPLEGDRHWPRVPCELQPPPIKIGPGRPRKNRRRDPEQDPKKPGTLKRTGSEMTCSLCKVKGHNKRRCPNRDTIYCA